MNSEVETGENVVTNGGARSSFPSGVSVGKGTSVRRNQLGEPTVVEYPARFAVNDNMIIPPAERPDEVDVIRGPNIKPLPEFHPMPDTVRGRVLIKVGDNITTDDISPAGAKILPLRSNLPAISEYVFSRIDPQFVQRVKERGGGIVVVNYPFLFKAAE